MNSNLYETMLIQRAKAFQVVKRKGTVMKETIPNHMKIPEVVGKTFHLPPPPEETMQKLCSNVEAINKNPGFHILLRSVPKNLKLFGKTLLMLNKYTRL